MQTRVDPFLGWEREELPADGRSVEPGPSHSRLLSPLLLGGHVGERQALGDSVVLELGRSPRKRRKWQGAVCSEGDTNCRNRVTGPGQQFPVEDVSQNPESSRAHAAASGRPR